MDAELRAAELLTEQIVDTVQLVSAHPHSCFEDVAPLGALAEQPNRNVRRRR